MKVSRNIVNCLNCRLVYVLEWEVWDEESKIDSLVFRLRKGGVQVRDARKHPKTGEAVIELTADKHNTDERILAVLQAEHNRGLITLE